jgi:hypothetical protein
MSMPISIVAPLLVPELAQLTKSAAHRQLSTRDTLDRTGKWDHGLAEGSFRPKAGQFRTERS